LAQSLDSGLAQGFCYLSVTISSGFRVGARRPLFVCGGGSVSSTVHEKERTLQRDVTRLVEGALPGVDVLALELNGKGRFCVFVDHPQGVDHALCARVTEVLRGYLDRYSIEISSPGLDRPLRTRSHFERAVGQTVRIKTASMRARGSVVSAGERAVRVMNGSKTAAPVDIPYDEIVRANLIYEGMKG
jgi:ribosome maturation factor RimP